MTTDALNEMPDPINVPLEIARILGIDPNSSHELTMTPEPPGLLVTITTSAYVYEDSGTYRPLVNLLRHYRLVPLSEIGTPLTGVTG